VGDVALTDEQPEKETMEIIKDGEEVAFPCTKAELRVLAEHWWMERIVHDVWYFIYQQAERRASAVINLHLNCLEQVLGPEAMAQARQDAIKNFRERSPKISAEDWRVFTSGTEAEKDAWRAQFEREGGMG
jgi:hypothetical protein